MQTDTNSPDQQDSGVASRLRSLAEAQRGRLVLWLPVFMAAGVVAYDALRFEPPGWVGAAVGIAALLLTRLTAHPIPRGMAILAVAASLGMASAQFATWRAAPVTDMPSRATIVTGTVRAVEQLPQGRRITIAAPRLDGGTALPRHIRLRLRPGDETPLATGDSVQVRAMLARPSPPAFPGGWDLQRDAFFAGMGGFGFALNPVIRVAEGAPSGLGAWLQSARERIISRVTAAIPGVPGTIGATLLTGGTSSIPEADRAAFRDSGLAHLLAIAGLHIGIVMTWVFGATRLGLAFSERAALHWPLKTIAAIAALAVGGAYMVLTGAHVPIIRSFAMASLVTLGVVLGRRALSLRGLGLAMVVLIALAPHEVLGVSFQMSFSAVLALIAGYEALRPFLSRLHGDGIWRRRLAGHIVALALTSALAGTASAPYGAYHFGHIQLYYVFANMLAVPVTAFLVMPAGMLAFLLMPFHLEALALVPMGWGIEAILWIGHAVAGWPAAVLAVPHMPPWGLAVFSLGLAWLGIFRGRLRLAGIVAILLGVLSPMTAPTPDILLSADGRLLAVRVEGRAYVQATGGASRFTRDAWLQLWAVKDADKLPVVGYAADGAIACGRTMCSIDIKDRTTRLLRGSEFCQADLLISAEPIRHYCAPTIPLVDRFSVWRDGAHAIWIDAAGVRILSDRAHRGDRPWVPRAVARSRVPPGLTMAPSEKLPDETLADD